LDYEQVTIETPEHVSISYELAGPGSRLLAATLDHLIIALGIAAVLLLALGLEIGLPDFGAPLVIVMVVVGGPLILLVAYFSAFEAVWSGQTPGKRAAGLRVMRDDGTPAAVLDILIRNTVRIIDFLPYFYFVGGLVAFVHRQSKRLGDLAAGTVVVKLREGALPVAALTEAPPEAALDDLAVLMRPIAAVLAPEERGIIDRFLERRHELTPPVRAEMAQRVLEAVRPRLTEEAAALAAQAPEAVLEALAQAGAASRERY
jgi:uncharacterized RDD family membrane protein YckC